MAVDPSLVISIDRSGLPGLLSPLVCSGLQEDEEPFTVVSFIEPARQRRVRWSTSDYEHGDVPVGWTWQQALLNFELRTDGVSEAVSRELMRELEAALSQLEYEVTITTDDAPAETWLANLGDIGAATRSYANLRDGNPVWPVAIPAYPIRSVA